MTTMTLNIHNKIFTFDSKWNTRCKDSVNRRQNQIKKHFFYFFVYIPPILSLIINNQSSITHPLVRQPRPRRINTRNYVA